MATKGTFSPMIYRDWWELFETTSVEDKAELLKAITLFPDYEPKAIPIWGFIKLQLQKQVDHVRDKSEARKNAANSRWGNAKDANASDASICNAKDANAQNAVQDDSLQCKRCLTVPNRTEPKKENTKEKSSPVARPSEVSEGVWRDWLAFRKKRKADVTQTVLNNFIREAKKAGFTLEEAISTSITKGWTGFDASWVGKGQYQSPQPEKESIFNVKHIERLNAARNRIYRVEKEDPIPDFFTAAVAKMGSV